MLFIKQQTVLVSIQVSLQVVKWLILTLVLLFSVVDRPEKTQIVRLVSNNRLVFFLESWLWPVNASQTNLFWFQSIVQVNEEHLTADNESECMYTTSKITKRVNCMWIEMCLARPDKYGYLISPFLPRKKKNHCLVNLNYDISRKYDIFVSISTFLSMYE